MPFLLISQKRPGSAVHLQPIPSTLCSLAPLLQCNPLVVVPSLHCTPRSGIWSVFTKASHTHPCTNHHDHPYCTLAHRLLFSFILSCHLPPLQHLSGRRGSQRPWDRHTDRPGSVSISIMPILAQFPRYPYGAACQSVTRSLWSPSSEPDGPKALGCYPSFVQSAAPELSWWLSR